MAPFIIRMHCHFIILSQVKKQIYYNNHNNNIPLTQAISIQMIGEDWAFWNQNVLKQYKNPLLLGKNTLKRGLRIPFWGQGVVCANRKHYPKILDDIYT